MNLTDFYKTYPDEEACERALREYRECNTLYCPECGGLHLSWNPSHRSWTCTDCGHETASSFRYCDAGQQTSGFRLVRGDVPDCRHQAGHFRFGSTVPAWKEAVSAGLGNDA